MLGRRLEHRPGLARVPEGAAQAFRPGGRGGRIVQRSPPQLLCRKSFYTLRQPEITLVQKTSVLRRIQMAQCYGCPQHLFRFVSARP